MNGYNFIVTGGQKEDPERKGKLIWPDSLNLKMNRFYAFILLSSLSNQLRDSECKEITISWCGKLEKNEC